MAEIRKFVITPGKPFLIDPYEGEPFEVQLAGAPRQWRMTFGTTPAGDAIYFRDGFGPMEFTPDNLRGLTEGDGYDANAQVPVGGDIIVLSTGRFTKRPSITGPAGPGTFFLIGAQHFRTMTQGEYDALGAYDPDTIYMIEDPPGRIVRIYRGEVLHRDDTVQPGDSWTPILTENADGTITLSAENNVVTSGEYVLYTVADPVGRLYQSELPIVLAGVTIADEPRVALPPKVAELFPPLVFLGLPPVTATALEGETIYVQLTGSVDGGKEPYEFSGASLGSINETLLAIPQDVFDGQVTFTVTDARNQSIEGFVDVTIDAPASAVTAVLAPSVSPLYRGQTLADADFFAEMTALENYENAASVTFTYQGVADQNTPLTLGQTVGLTAHAVSYLGAEFTFKSNLMQTQFDVRITATQGNEAWVEINSLVEDGTPVSFEVLENVNPDYDGLYTKTAAEWRAGPVALVAPEILGENGYDVGDLLQVQPGFFTTPTGNLTTTYQWVRDGVDILAATAPEYTIVDADSGTELSCREIGNDGPHAPVSAISNAIAVTAGVPSDSTFTQIQPIAFSTTTLDQPQTLTYDCGPATPGAELLIQFTWGDTGNTDAGDPIVDLDGVQPERIHGNRLGACGIVWWKWDVSSGGVKTMTVDPNLDKVWRGYGHRALLLTGDPLTIAGGADLSTATEPLDVGASVQIGDLILGGVIIINSGTTGDFDLVGLTEIAGGLLAGTRRAEFLESTADATGVRTMTVTRTGDSSGVTVAATMILRGQ